MTFPVLAPAAIDERYRRLRLTQPAAERSVRESMAKLGQLQPMVVCSRDTTSALLDGFKRLSAARELGLAHVRVHVVQLSETAAVAAVMSLNRGGRGLSDLEQALCVRVLVREHGLCQVAVGELLGRHKSWVSRRLSLAERLSEEVSDDVRAGLLTTSAAREVARLPRGNQRDVATAIAKAQLTSHEASALVTLFDKSQGATARTYLLTHPREALAALGPKTPYASHDPRLGPLTQVLRQRLYGALRTMGELTSRLEDCTPSRWTETEREVLFPVVDKVHGVATLLVDKLAASRGALGAPPNARS